MSTTRKELHWGRVMSCYSERPRSVNLMMSEIYISAAGELALVDGSSRMTYRDVERAVSALAAGLGGHGVCQGDRVAVMIPNQAEAALAVLAIARLGAVVVPLGPRLKKPEISHIFEDAIPVAVIHAAAFATELPGTSPASNMRFECGGRRWQAMLERNPADVFFAAEVDEHEPFGILYTSGTTGKPKGVVLTHLNVVHYCLHWEDAHQLSRSERTLVCVPWSHVAGLCGVVMPFLAISGTLVFVGEFKRREFLLQAQAGRITHALMVPAMYGLCLLEPDLEAFDLSSWRIGAYGSASMPEPTIRRFAQIFPQLQMCNCYGATETTSPATIMPRGDGVAHAESIGKAVPCGDICVMDEQGREVLAGKEGELWIAGPMVVPGYWNNGEGTDVAFAGGYWKSGDVGAIDAQGYVRIADRMKDMVDRGDFKVYPAEVESVLTGIDGVVEDAVIGHPDNILSESVIAFLNVVSDAIDEGMVRVYCAERMADYKVPGRVVVGKAPLPRNANGKIQKAELRETAKTLPP